MRVIRKWMALVLTIGLVSGSIIYQLGTYMNADELEPADEPVVTEEEQQETTTGEKVEVVEKKPEADSGDSSRAEEPAPATAEEPVVEVSDDSKTEDGSGDSTEKVIENRVRDVVVKAENKSKIYGQLDPEFTVAVDGADKSSSINYNIGRVESDSDNVGTHAIDVYGRSKQGDYKVSYVDGTLTIRPQSINPDDDDYIGVMMDFPVDEEFDGEPHQWVPIVTGATERANAKGGFVFKRLKEGLDYTVNYSTSDFTKADQEITVIVTGKGNYTGTVTKEYRIIPVEGAEADPEEPAPEEEVADAGLEPMETPVVPERQSNTYPSQSEALDIAVIQASEQAPSQSDVFYRVAEAIDKAVTNEETFAAEHPEMTVDQLELARLARIDAINHAIPKVGMGILGCACGIIVIRKRRLRLKLR